MSERQLETIGRLTQALDFDFDPTRSHVSQPLHYFYGQADRVAVSDRNQEKCVEFTREQYTKPPLDFYPKVSWGEEKREPQAVWREWPDRGSSSKDPYQDSLHGLITDTKGEVALFSRYGDLDGYFYYHMVNGPTGANKVNETLGRVPGSEVPLFVTADFHRTSTPGEITEAIAEMKMWVPGVNDFSTIAHDLGLEYGSHGPSWPHAHPLAYRQLSRAAQDVIEKHGPNIHVADTREPNHRPPQVVRIARTLDDLILRLKPTIAMMSAMERGMRSGTYDDVSDEGLATDMMRKSLRFARWRQHQTAHDFLLEGVEPFTAESYRKGYWIGAQLVAGVVETRMALHQERPHAEATDEQTRRTLGVLHSIKKAIDSRLADNKDSLLAA